MKKVVFPLIKEFFIFLGCYFFLFFPFRWKWKKGKNPILLVHGYLNNSNVWIFLGNFLQKRGFGPIYTINLKGPFLSIEGHAKKLEEKVQKIAKETNNKNIILIGHSMGALVSLFFGLKMKTSVNVLKIICIAAPFQGTKTAFLGIGKSAKEMRYRSDFVLNLKKEIEKNKKIKIYHVASTCDQIVIPNNSAILENENRRFIVNNLGHASLLFSKKIANQIAIWLHG